MSANSVILMHRFDQAAYLQYASWYADNTDEELQRRMQPPTEQWLTYVTTTSGVHAWAFYLNQVMVGMLQMDTVAVKTGAIGFVVSKAFRNHGLGRKMLALVVAEARTMGMQRIVAEVEPENVASLLCLTAAGFMLSGTAPNEDGYLRLSRNI